MLLTNFQDAGRTKEAGPVLDFTLPLLFQRFHRDRINVEDHYCSTQIFVVFRDHHGSEMALLARCRTTSSNHALLRT